MATPEFTLAPPTANGLTNTFKCIFASTAPASKWVNRASALVLTPNDPIPADAQLKVTIGDATTRLYKSGSSFIVPLSLLKAGENTVTLTLESDLFPADGGTYNFTAKWLISQSKVDKAPLNGDEAAKVENMTFTAPAKATPSLKITGG